MEEVRCSVMDAMSFFLTAQITILKLNIIVANVIEAKAQREWLSGYWGWTNDYFKGRNRMTKDNELYLVTTVVSTHRMRYAIPISAMSEEGDMPLPTDQAIDWIQDSVTMDEVEEFSQHWMGESIVDTFVLDKERVLNLYKRDNPHVVEVMTDQKILDRIADWKIKK